MDDAVLDLTYVYAQAATDGSEAALDVVARHLAPRVGSLEVARVLAPEVAAEAVRRLSPEVRRRLEERRDAELDDLLADL